MSATNPQPLSSITSLQFNTDPGSQQYCFRQVLLYFGTSDQRELGKVQSPVTGHRREKGRVTGRRGGESERQVERRQREARLWRTRGWEVRCDHRPCLGLAFPILQSSPRMWNYSPIADTTPQHGPLRPTPPPSSSPSSILIL